MAKKSNSAFLERLMKNSDQVFKAVASESKYLKNTKPLCVTSVPMLNVALSGDIDGGLYSGILTIAGESKRFKTMYALYMLADFQKQNPESIGIFYDTEFGSNESYFDLCGVDMTRVLHIPITCVEELKTEVSKQLDDLYTSKKSGEEISKVFMIIDSVGNLASRKEINDALEGKEVADMTRAKQLKSFFRIITTQLKLLDIPLICINHIYKSQSFIPEEIVGGGTGGTYGSDNIWIIGRQQDRSTTGDKEVLGYSFIIKVKKSRFIKEDSKIPIRVYWEEGLKHYSGLSDLAVEFGLIKETKQGRSPAYEYEGVTVLAKDIDSDEAFWSAIFENTDMKERIRTKFKIDGKTKLEESTSDED